MLGTTALLALAARRLWGWGAPLTAAVVGLLLVDLAFFAVNMVKVPQGGWFPLLVGAVAFTLMSTWRRGRQTVLERASEDNPPLDRFVAGLDPSALPRVKGTAVHLTARRGALRAHRQPAAQQGAARACRPAHRGDGARW